MRAGNKAFVIARKESAPRKQMINQNEMVLMPFYLPVCKGNLETFQDHIILNKLTLILSELIVFFIKPQNKPLSSISPFYLPVFYYF